MAATLTSGNELTYVSFPIEKVEQTEDGNVTVWGKATDDSVDSDEQIVDANFAAKALAGWMDSGPNVRVQHQAQRDPAGVGITVERDGDAHWVKSKIIEPVAKQLVLGGALRAYSVGIARPTIQRDAKARGGRITDGMIVEISLVDRPANKNCGIQLVKMAGGELVTKVFGSDDVITKNAVEDVTLVMPSDIQMSFTPLDMAKIIARKNGNNGDSLGKFITKQVEPGLYSPDEMHESESGVSALEKAEAIIEEREYEATFTGKRKLTTETRNALPSSAFVFPDKRKYPIHDRSHASNALSRASGKPEEARVRAAVAARYPGLGKKTANKGDDMDAQVWAHLEDTQDALMEAMHDQAMDTDKAKKKARKAAARVANEAIPDVTKPVVKTDSDSDDKTKAMCLGCGAKQNSEHAFCTECGKTMAGAPAVEKNHDFACLGCGKDLDKGERFCPDCGKANPGHNPMADLKIPSNKAEGSRVADELVVTDPAEKKKKSKGDRVATKPGQMPGEDAGSYTAKKKAKRTGDRVATKPGQMPGEDAGSYTGKAKKKKGNPFGGNQAAPFGKKPDADDTAEKEIDAQSGPSSMPRAGGTAKSGDAAVTRPKGEGLGGPKSSVIAIEESMPNRSKKRKRAKDIPTGTVPGHSVPGGESSHPVPGHMQGATDQVFDRDMGGATKVFSDDPQVGVAMKLKSLGVTHEDGFLHDLTCPAYSWEDVQKAYPDGLAGFSAKSWQDKALEIAATAPLAQAKSAVMLGQHAYTLKNASVNDLIEVKMDIYKAFRDANPGPGSFPSPHEICATGFQRPKISSGRAAYSHQYDAPNSAKVPASGTMAASHYQRDYISSGTAHESPANKGEGAPYPDRTGVVMNLDYTSVHKQNVLDAMSAMHDHFDRVMPSGVCPLMHEQTTPAAHPVVAAKSADEPVIEKKVTPDGMTGKQRKKLQKKLTKKVMSGKMPLDQARIRMGKKPKKSPEPLAPQKAAQPDVTKAATFDADALTKAFSAVLRKSQKQSDKKIADLTRTVNALADQPDPGTQPFKGLALNPIRKSASPAGVQEIAGVAERTQMMILHELEDTARNSPDPAQREAAWNQVLKYKGLA